MLGASMCHHLLDSCPFVQVALNESADQQIDPVAGQEKDRCATGKIFLRTREIVEAQAGGAGDQNADGVKIKNDQAAVGEEGEGIEKKRGAEVAVEELDGRARRAAGDAGKSGQRMKDTLRGGQMRGEPGGQGATCA